MKKILLFLTAVLLLGLSACTENDIPVTGVELNYNTATLDIGDTKTKIATVLPQNATNQNISWTSSNPEIVSIGNNGQITAMAAGTATITVTTEDGGRTATSTITVNPPSVQCDICGAWDCEKQHVQCPICGTWNCEHTHEKCPVCNEYDCETPHVQCPICGAYDCETEYITTDEGVVINGVRWATRNLNYPGTFAPYPHSAGRLYQWGTLDGVTHHWVATGTVTGWNNNNNRTVWTAVNDPCPAGWRVPTLAELTNLSSQHSTWTQQSGVDGRIFGTASNRLFLPASGFRNASGALSNVGQNAIFWGRMPNGDGMWMYLSGSVDVGLNHRAFGASIRCVADVPITGVTLDRTSMTLYVGSTDRLIATVTPTYANQTVTWHSSNTSVATVNASGLVSAISTGTATITVATECDKHTATSTVTVNPLPVQCEICGAWDCETEHVQCSICNSWDCGEKCLTNQGVFVAGMYWATRNAGTNRTFAENHGADGALFQWNRLQGWAATGAVTGWNAMVPIGSAWYPQNDPCPDGWRVPTQAELQGLSNTTGDWVTAATAQARGFTTSVSGRIFPSGATADNGIFLPATRNRNTSGAFPITGAVFGSYWSSTQDVITNANAVRMSIGGSGSNSSMGLASRANGFGIRCVQDIPATGVIITPDNTTVVTGSQQTLTATVLPAGASKVVSWHSSNPAVVTVDANGVLTPVTQGTATITVTTEDGGHTADATVTIIPDTTPSVLIAGTLWATRNVGSNRIFAENHGAAGMLFQWNRPQGWATANSGTIAGWNNTTAAGSAWYSENDPCPDGWRVPTQAELQALNNTSGDWVTAASAQARGFITTVSGRIFPSGATVDNGIFLPAVNARNASGTVPITGAVSGRYWSSTPDATLNANAVGFHFGSGNSGEVRVSRAVGYSVRCVVAGGQGDNNNNNGQGGGITTDDGVVINGVRWATRNVDAPGTFATNPEDAGMLYQWNRRIGWSSTNPMVNSDGGTMWDNSRPTGTEWYAENDPCPEGWRVPTRNELHSLRDAGGKWMTQNGVSGHLFGSGDNQIFIPIAHTRRYYGRQGSFAESAVIWGRERVDNYRAVSIWFRPQDHLPSSAIEDITAGQSVRCVAK